MMEQLIFDPEVKAAILSLLSIFIIRGGSLLLAQLDGWKRDAAAAAVDLAVRAVEQQKQSATKSGNAVPTNQILHRSAVEIARAELPIATRMLVSQSKLDRRVEAAVGEMNRRKP